MLSRKYEVHANVLYQLVIYLLYTVLTLKKEIKHFSFHLINATLLRNIHDIYKKENILSSLYLLIAFPIQPSSDVIVSVLVSKLLYFFLNHTTPLA